MVSSSKGVDVMVCGLDHSGSQPFNIVVGLGVEGGGRVGDNILHTSLIFSGCVSSAAPMPPFRENSFGQPMLTSIPTTSPSLHRV